jgi:hypothetical protein
MHFSLLGPKKSTQKKCHPARWSACWRILLARRFLAAAGKNSSALNFLWASSEICRFVPQKPPRSAALQRDK